MSVSWFSAFSISTDDPLQDDMHVVGRITLDSDSTAGSKLNEASLALESSRMLGSGARVPLRFDSAVKIRGGVKGTAGMGLFPGAMAALKGKNGGAGIFLVTEILAVSAFSIFLVPIS
jgi:DNA polymerase alpha subunit B